MLLLCHFTKPTFVFMFEACVVVCGVEGGVALRMGNWRGCCGWGSQSFWPHSYEQTETELLIQRTTASKNQH